MKRLYVGCRVRIVHGGYVVPSRRHHIGKEGRIVGTDVRGKLGDRFEWEVELSGGEHIAANSSVLEPIQDPGHQVGTWEGCVWKPEWVRAWSA
jgi:hypothetical protein